MSDTNQSGRILLFEATGTAENDISNAISKYPDALKEIDQLHFASIGIVELDEKPYVLLELNFDGSFKSLITSLWDCPLIPEVLSTTSISPPKTLGQFNAALDEANQGEGYPFTALPGATTTKIEKDQKLIEAARHHRDNGPDVANARSLVDSLLANSDVKVLLCEGPGLKKPTQLVRTLFPLLTMLFGMILSVTMLAGTGMPLSQDSFGLFTQVAVVGLTTLSAIAGLLLLLLDKWTWKSLVRRATGIVTLAGVAATVYFSNDSSMVLYSTWWSYALLLVTVAVVLVVGVNQVPSTEFFDRFVFRMAALGLPTIAVLMMFAHTTDPGLSRGSTILLIILFLAGMLVYSIPNIGRSNFARGILYGIPLSIAMCFWGGFPEGLAAIASSASILIFCIGYFVVAALCHIEEAERTHQEYPALWVPTERGNAVLIQEANREGHQNHLLSITKIKPGRRWLLKLVLWFVIFLHGLQGVRAQLSGIRTIHFARWIILKNGYLGFCSNYDNAWGAYLDEFIDEAGSGITAIWSNTSGYPLTHWLSGGGTAYAQRFKTYARQSQYPVLLHYKRFPHLSIGDKSKAEQLREILTKPDPTDADCELIARIL